MRLIIISNDKEIIYVSNVPVDSSVSIHFILNQIKNKKLKIFIINLFLIKTNSLLKLFGHFKNKFTKNNSNRTNDLNYFSDKFNFCSENQQFLRKWNIDYLNTNIESLLELLKTAYLLGVKKLVDLVLHGIGIIFIRRIITIHIYT